MGYVNKHDIVEAHCYFVDIGQTDREQIRSRINNNDCRTFRLRRPLSTAYKTVLCTVDKGHPAIIVIGSATYLLTISSPDIQAYLMTKHDEVMHIITKLACFTRSRRV